MLFVLGGLLSLPALAQDRNTDAPMAEGTQQDVQMSTANWPKAQQDAIALLTKKYGKPAAITADVVMWKATGPFTNTNVYREGRKHDFPMPHTDLMEQVVAYKVPAEKADELMAFDGSITFDRTGGTMTARCDKEPMNLLALNLAHDIIQGKRTVEDARAFYAQTAMKVMKGGSDPYVEKLLFAPMPNAADADMPAKDMAGMMKK